MNNTSKVIYITLHNICKPSAMANRTISIVNALSEKGIDVEIASLALYDDKYERPLDLIEQIQLKFYARKRWGYLLQHFVVMVKFFFQTVRRENVTLYIYGYYRFFELYLLSISRLKRFYIIREITEYPGYNAKLNGIETKLMSFIFRRTNLIVVISHALKNYISKFTSSPIIIINMTVDIHRFANNVNNYKPIISYCGNINSSKDGLPNLIRAFAIFRKSVDEKYILRLIGDNSDQKKIRPLMELCKSEGVEDHVQFTGSVDRTRIPFLLSESKMLALCRPDNRQAEGGFPTKLGEYLATGRPVVVTDVGEISNFIKDGVNGYVAENDQPDVFASKMLEVYHNFSKAIIVGQQGKVLARNEFSATTETEKLLPYLPGK